jgi:hypothetical protein
MALTPLQIKAAFFAVLHSGSGAASVAVRAALGAGAASVIVREDLVSPLPATPFVALQWGARASGGARNRAVKIFYPVWFLYDSTLYRQSRLDPLVALIEAAYTEDALSMCYTDFLPVRELLDEALSLPAKSMPFEIRTRG